MRQSRLAGGYHYLQPEALATACTEIRAYRSLTLYRIDQPGCDIARAFLEVQYYTPTIGSASHESGTYGGNADLDKSDAGVGIVVLRSRTHDDDGLAGFDHRKTFPDRCYDRPSRDRPSRRGVVRKMNRRPRPQLMIVGQCRQGLEREFLRIDQVSV